MNNSKIIHIKKLEKIVGAEEIKVGMLTCMFVKSAKFFGSSKFFGVVFSNSGGDFSSSF